jgi:hypothetical protein
MKKTLLIAAAALAAGVISSQAQVYSQNIVGYVNQKLIVGLTLVNAPVSPSGAGTNSAEVLFPTLTSGDQLYIWKPNGSGFDVAYYNGPGDWYDGFTFAPISVPILKSGAGLYYQNNSPAPYTNTFVGTALLTNSQPIIVGLSLVSSTAPVGGSVESTNFSLPFVSGDQLYLWKPDGSGFKVAYYNGPGDWYDGYTFAPIPVPTLTVGSGFYYQNNNTATNWIQNFVVPQ